MYVVVIGAGEVGGYLATLLVQEGHEVAVIEVDAARAAALDGELDALVVAGSGLTREAMARAGIDRADLVLAVTAIDEVNLIACMVAERAHPGVRTVARVRAEPYYLADEPLLAADDLGLDLIMSPERAVADEVLDLLRYGGPAEIRQLAGGRLVLVGLGLGPSSPLVGTPLAALAPDLPRRALVVAVRGRRGFRIPRGDDRLAVDERAYVLGVPEQVNTLLALSGVTCAPIARVLLVGCGQVGFAVARELERRGTRPVVLEKDEARAEWVAGRLTSSLVIHADGSNLELLRERVETDRPDAVVVLLEDDEKSLLIGLFAKSLGAGKAVCRCDNLAYAPLANTLGVDAVVTPKRAVANAILRHVRRGTVESTVVLGDHEAEIIHFRVPARPRHPDLLVRPLRALPIPREALVAAVVRQDGVFVPRGDAVLRAGDGLLIATLPRAVPEVDRLLAGE